MKVSPMKGVMRFGVKGKLAPRYIEPFPILEKCETVGYKLNLPPMKGVMRFKVENHMYFRVSPMKGVMRFGVKGKLAPRYIRPFPILEKCGTVAYKLNLPPSLARVHDIFHVLQLKMCLKAHVDVVLSEVTPLKADLSYSEHPIKVLAQKDRVMRHKTIKFFKIQWSNHSEEEAMWESDDFLRSRHPDFVLL
jgi:hypothetical protein